MSSDAPSAPRSRDDGPPDPPTVLPHHGAYPWDAVLAYLGARAVTGIERADAGVYRRALAGPGGDRELSVRPAARGGGFEVRICGPGAPPARAGAHAAGRVAATAGGSGPRQMAHDPAADHAATAAVDDPAAHDPAAHDPAAHDPAAHDPAANHPTADDPAVWLPRITALFAVDAPWRRAARHLAGDALLAPAFARWPGLRVPGAWDGFEWAVRVVLGQHVSVRAASTFSERLVERFGEPSAPDAPGRHFPSPGHLARAEIEAIGVTRGRAGAVRALAAAAVEDPALLVAGGDPVAFRARLLALPGVGPWTAEVIAMRALRDADAFPAGDLVLRRAAGGLTEAELRRHAERWRPYRAYAAMALWWGVAHRP